MGNSFLMWLTLWVLCGLPGLMPIAVLGNALPKVGLGIGNLEHDKVKDTIELAVNQYDLKLIDTAMASNNHHLVASSELKHEPFVITKVWYTYLGAARTTYAVEQALVELNRPALDCVLLHWPYCHDDIEWMNCAKEEAQLPEEVKSLGPAPHLAEDRSAVWKESWRSLEKLHSEGKIKHIGVSNFNHREMQELVDFARIPPTYYQGDMWSLVFDPYLTQTLRYNAITFQVYNVFRRILPRLNNPQGEYKERVDTALSHVKDIAKKATRLIQEHTGGLDSELTVEQMILLWVLHHDAMIIPRATSLTHLNDLAQVQKAYVAGTLGGTILNSLKISIEEIILANHQMPTRLPKDEL